MKSIGFVFGVAVLSAVADAGTVVIDDFTFAQGPFAASSGNLSGADSEIGDPSIYGGVRRAFATGFIYYFSPDTSGTSTLAIGDGKLSLSKTALSGSAFVSYNGRFHTSGDRIGDLNLDIAGTELSLAGPVALFEYETLAADQVISMSLASSVDAIYFFDILLPAGSNRTYFDVANALPPPEIGAEPLNFAEVDEIGLGLFGGKPVGSVELHRFSFVPEPSAALLWSAGVLCLLGHRRIVVAGGRRLS